MTTSDSSALSKAIEPQSRKKCQENVGAYGNTPYSRIGKIT
ncbi:MAG: hypothetical protein Q9P01_19815 [Anaerolineae bacterium]|nr:hypothetical protein [Anaerolineae bacterium]